MEKKDIGREIARVSWLKGRFLLRSGIESNHYLDKYLFEGDPKLLEAIAAQLAELVPAGTEKIAGLELGGVPLATAVAIRTSLPLLIVRKKAKEYGTGKIIEGPFRSGDRICVIEDVITSGGQVIASARDIEEAGGKILGILCVIDREQGGEENLLSAGYKLTPLFRLSELGLDTA